MNGLHEQYRNGLIENGEYLQGVLDGVADWGTELCDAVDAGRMSVVYLALWHEKADELHRDWKAARNKLKTILKQGGIV